MDRKVLEAIIEEALDEVYAISEGGNEEERFGWMMKELSSDLKDDKSSLRLALMTMVREC